MTLGPGETAAQAWLQRLPLADRLAAHAATDVRLMVWLIAGLVLLAACLLVARSDLIGRVSRALEREAPRPWLAGAVTAALLAFVLALCKGAYDAFVAWPLEGLAMPSAGARVAAAASGVLPAVALTLLVVPPLQWLFRVRPRSGPWIAGLAAIGLALAVGWGPYAFGTDRSASLAPAGPVRTGLEQLILDANLPAQGLYLSRAPGFDADVTGGFGRAQVVIGQPVLGWSPAEARAYVGHLAGHYAHADVFWVFLIYGVVALAALVAIQALAAPLARALGAHGVTAAFQPEALPAAAMILVLAAGAAPLAVNGYLRWANVRADSFSLAHAREPDGLAAVLLRTWDHESVDPNPLETALFYSHPPLTQRLDHAMRWKAEHAS